MSFKQTRFENISSQKNTSKKTESVKSKKEIAWENWQKEVEHIVDSLGHKIDNQIKKTVVAFNVIGLPTSASCEGHIDHGTGAPWIEVAARHKPEERYIDEKEIFQEVAKKYKTSFENVRRAIHDEAYAEAIKKSCQNDETSEYKQWREKTKKLMNKTSKLLEEFYSDRNVASNIKLGILRGGEGGFRVRNGEEDYNRSILEKLTDEQKKEHAQKLAQYQKEMEKFTAFLKDQYFSEK